MTATDRGSNVDRPSGPALLDALESGAARAAEPTAGGWVVNAWVKEGILDLFRSSEIVPQGVEGTGAALVFRDKAPLTVRRFDEDAGVRIVPGGSAVRRGAYVASGVVLAIMTARQSVCTELLGVWPLRASLPSRALT